MKIYSIGREVGCDIPINDRTDVVSRRHAILNVTSTGKMTIVDQSSNGTYVNGIRISSNVPVPVTRKDNISFAHVARLDWNLVPNPAKTIWRWVIIGILALLFIIGGILGYNLLSNSGDPEPQAAPPMVSVQEMEDQVKAKADEVQKHLRDSLRRDSLEKVRKKIEEEKNKKRVKGGTHVKGSGKKTSVTPPPPKKEEPVKRIGR